MRKLSLIVAAIMLIGTLFVGLTLLPEVRAATLYVGGGGPGNYTTIQEAINDAISGDTIYVYNGTYSEQVYISKGLTLVGENRNSIIDGGGSGPIMNAYADGISVTGFTLTNGGDWPGDFGLILQGSQSCQIINNSFESSYGGIYIGSSSNSIIANNSITSNYEGITLLNSDGITITTNYIGQSLYHAIALKDSSDSNVSSNDIRFNGVSILLDNSNVNTVTANWILGNNEGISLRSSSANTVHSNEILGSSNGGIRLQLSNNNLILNNTHSGNDVSVLLDSSEYNTLIANTASGRGVFITGDRLEHWNTHVIDSSNTVRGERVLYWKNASGGSVGLGVGQVILANYTDARVENLSFNQLEAGIEVGFSSDITVLNNSVKSSSYGLFALHSSRIVALANNFSNNWRGASISHTSHSSFGNNTMSYNTRGLDLIDSFNNTISYNTFSFNSMEGVGLEDSDSNTIANNTFTSNGFTGVEIISCRDNMVTGNNITSNGDQGIELLGTLGTTVEGNSIRDSEVGMRLYGSVNGTIALNNISDTHDGITLEYSNGNTIRENAIFGNEYYGVHLFRSDRNAIEENVAWDNWYGVETSSSNNITIDGNSIHNHTIGIAPGNGYHVVIKNNVLVDNPIGITLGSSVESMITNNSMNMGGIHLWGHSVEHWNTHIIETSNTVNGRPVRYWKNVSGGTVPSGAAQVLLANCTGVKVENQVLREVQSGIQVGFSSGFTITNLTTHDNYHGIYLWYSESGIHTNNTITGNINGIFMESSNSNTLALNTLSANEKGLFLVRSGSNTIYHNQFLNNIEQAMDYFAANDWDNGYPSGGNYWSDYSGVDQFSGPNQDQPGSDGIGDTPYVVDPDSQDMYPLMTPIGPPPPPRPPALGPATLSGHGIQNITLEWSLSPDDDGGSGMVIRYDIFRHSSFDSQGSGYSLLSSVPKGSSHYVDSDAGEGDPSNYFYRVCAVDLTGNGSCSPNQAAKFIRPLAPGPNLVSVPLIQSNESIETVLQTVEYDKAWFYDGKWNWHMKDKTYSGGLLGLNHTMGIWVDVTQDCNLTVAGLVPAQTTIELRTGWNLVSFPSLNSSYTVADLGAETGATRVEGYNPAPPHFLRVLGDADVLLAGYGYWVEVQADTDWIVEVS